MERVFSFDALILVVAITSSGVSGFPKLIHRSLNENVGITMNKIPETESKFKTTSIEIQESDRIINDELNIARTILERVPLIDGYVHLTIVLEG